MRRSRRLIHAIVEPGFLLGTGFKKKMNKKKRSTSLKLKIFKISWQVLNVTYYYRQDTSFCEMFRHPRAPRPWSSSLPGRDLLNSLVPVQDGSETISRTHDDSISNLQEVEELRMLYVYTPSQKFNTIRISVLRDIIKMWKKSTTLKILQNIYFVP